MDLKSYINGKRHGKEANKLEKKAMNDPFLQDAIDGYDSVPGNHAETIEKLEERFASQPKRIDKRVWLWAAAAVVANLIGIPFLLRQPDVEDVQVASSESVQEEETATLSPQKDTVLVTENSDFKETEAPKPMQIPSPATHEDERKPTGQIILEQVVVEKPAKNEIHVAAVRDILEATTEVPTSPISEKLVSGRLVDVSGEPVIGGTVNLKGSQIGTVSDMEGKFKFSVPKNEGGTLIASFVGMENTEIPLKENVGNIVMKEDTELLSEMAVVGYGTQRKSTMTGSVSKTTVEIPIFGETEFEKYFKANYDKTLCAGEPVSVTVEFFINAQGRPGNIVIKENSCPELETEIKRLLLGSPQWSEANRKVTLKMELNG